MWLRQRNDAWELKVPVQSEGDGGEGVYRSWEMNSSEEVIQTLLKLLNLTDRGQVKLTEQPSLHMGEEERLLNVIADIETQRQQITLPISYIPRVIDVANLTLFTAAARASRAAENQLKGYIDRYAATTDALRDACERLRFLEKPPKVSFVLDVAHFLPRSGNPAHDGVAVAEIEIMLHPECSGEYSIVVADNDFDNWGVEVVEVEEGEADDTAPHSPTAREDAELVLEHMLTSLTVAEELVPRPTPVELAMGKTVEAKEVEEEEEREATPIISRRERPASKVLDYLRVRQVPLLEKVPTYPFHLPSFSGATTGPVAVAAE